MDYLIVVERTILFYILITFLYRFMGKREVGQLGMVDLIVSILIAELAAISIDNREESIFINYSYSSTRHYSNSYGLLFIKKC